MAGRPVIKRNEKTYTRDLETIKRLRASILRFESGPTTFEAVAACNQLIQHLTEIRNRRQAA